jgi:hypothetical protein
LCVGHCVGNLRGKVEKLMIDFGEQLWEILVIFVILLGYLFILNIASFILCHFTFLTLLMYFRRLWSHLGINQSNISTNIIF